MFRCVDWKKNDKVFNGKFFQVTLIRGATPLAAARHIFLQRVPERNLWFAYADTGLTSKDKMISCISNPTEDIK